MQDERYGIICYKIKTRDLNLNMQIMHKWMHMELEYPTKKE